MAFNPTADVDEPAFYTRFGQSFIDFAAPGGNSDQGFYFDFLLDFCVDSDNLLCTASPLGVPFGTFDWVWSTDNLSRGGYLPQIGTSMAAPHAAGVAALIIGQNGGNMKPAQVEAKLHQSADDLGKPGNDDFYGGGRINAFNAVQ